MAAWLSAAGGAAALAGALGSQYLGGLAPCVLCVYQRYPYVVAIVLAVIALIAAPALARPALVLAGVAFLATAGIAAFHVGVEQHWWAGTSECGSAATGGGSIEDLRASLLATPVTPCDTPAFTLLGISMAGYNLVYALALAALALLGAARRSGGRA